MNGSIGVILDISGDLVFGIPAKTASNRSPPISAPDGHGHIGDAA